MKVTDFDLSPFPFRLVLASASPRRAELLRAAGYAFEVRPSPVEEPARRVAGIPLEWWPTALAFTKAYAVQKALGDDAAVVLGADTIVCLGGRVMNKPRDRTHARQMLLRLSGKTHRVITGVALLCGDRHRFAAAAAECRVKKLSAAWLERYLDTGLWCGKAGAYGLQDRGEGKDPFVTLVSGEWSTVVGLPMGLLKSELAALRGAGAARGSHGRA